MPRTFRVSGYLAFLLRTCRKLQEENRDLRARLEKQRETIAAGIESSIDGGFDDDSESAGYLGCIPDLIRMGYYERTQE